MLILFVGTGAITLVMCSGSTVHDVYLMLIVFVGIGAITLVVCSGSTMPLTCGSNQEIRVDRAVYGHYDNNVCPGPNHVSNCHLDGDFDIVDQLCSGQENCDIEIGRDVFGSDPCPNSQKYLDLDYTCLNSKC